MIVIIITMIIVTPIFLRSTNNINIFNENRVKEFEQLISDLQKFSNEQKLNEFRRTLDCYEDSADIKINLDVIQIIDTNKNKYKATITYNDISKTVTYKEV